MLAMVRDMVGVGVLRHGDSVTAKHQPGCGFYAKCDCTCDMEITFQDAVPHNLKE
jgi:hypothetical protein